MPYLGTKVAICQRDTMTMVSQLGAAVSWHPSSWTHLMGPTRLPPNIGVLGAGSKAKQIAQLRGSLAQLGPTFFARQFRVNGVVRASRL